MTPRAESRYGFSLFQLRLLGRTIAAIPPIAAARLSRAKRPPTCPPRQYFRDAIIGTSSITTLAATASHAARDRDSTSAAARTAPPSEPTSAPNGLRAVTVHQTRAGNPMTAM